MMRNGPANQRPDSVAVCSNLARAIIRTSRLEDVFEAALNALSDGLQTNRGSVLLFDTDGVMRFKAWRNLSDTYRKAVEGHTPWSPHDRNVATLVVPDVSADPQLAPYTTVFQAEGIAGLSFVPLEGANGVIGKFMLYFDRPRDLTLPERNLAELIAAQVAFAVERTAAHADARAGQERLRFALHAANMGTWDWDIASGKVVWSDNMPRIHHMSPEGFDGTFESYRNEIHPDDRERVRVSIERAIVEDAPHDVEYRIVTPTGAVQWVDGKGRVERNAEGIAQRMSGVCMNVTRRKEAELARVEALEQSHRATQRLAAIVASSDDAIVGKTLEGIITSWNAGAERLFGYSEPEAVGRSIMLIVPDDRLAEEDLVLSRVRSGNAIHMETLRRRKDGTSVPIALTVSPVKDANGHVIGASKIARDISDRRKHEAEREELHRRLAMLVSASATLLELPEAEPVRAATVSLARELLTADGAAVWSEGRGDEWRVVQSSGISDSFASRIITSYRGSPVTSSDAAGHLAATVPIADVDTHPMVQQLAAAYRDEGIRSMLVCPMRIHGNRMGTLVFYFRRSRVFGEIDIETGQALANVASAALTTTALLDEQRRQRAEAEIARHRATFLADAAATLSRSLDYEQTLADVARLAVPEIADWCAVDIVAENGSIQRLAVAHVDPEKVKLARELQERYPPDPNSDQGVYAVIRTGRPLVMESIPTELVAARARDEEHRRILADLSLSSLMCVPLASARGVLGAMTFVLSDSRRHYTSADLGLAEDVAARASLALDNAFAYSRVQMANRVKDEFLATLSHELRTPLNAVLGYAHMLMMNAVRGERQRAALEVMTRNAKALAEIIDDLLDVSRVSSGKLQLDVRPLSIREVVDSAIATMKPAIDAKSISLRVEADTKLPAISGDSDRLQQVVRNILSNAVKFVPAGGHIGVRLVHEGDGVVIEVSDNGPGIDPGFLPYVFERFRQADSRFSREHGGLGLGLAIVKELTELHGGTVSAASAGVGCGATFRVVLPARRDEVPVHPSEPPVRRRNRQELSGVRVLAVDDDADALELVRTILESAGATVVTHQTGDLALESLRRTPFDVVLCDLGMPAMDGLELIRRIRALPPPSNNVPAAALTAYARAEDRTTAMRRGFQTHLAKPINPLELVAAVSDLASRDVQGHV